jgi:hypothetical protein
VTFFERQPEKPQPVPQAADADLDLALSQQPRLLPLVLGTGPSHKIETNPIDT